MTPIPIIMAPKNRRSASRSNVAVVPSANQRLPKGPGPVAPKIKAGPPNRKNISKALIANKICKPIRFMVSTNHQRFHSAGQTVGQTFHFLVEHTPHNSDLFVLELFEQLRRPFVREVALTGIILVDRRTMWSVTNQLPCAAYTFDSQALGCRSGRGFIFFGFPSKESSCPWSSFASTMKPSSPTMLPIALSISSCARTRGDDLQNRGQVRNGPCRSRVATTSGNDFLETTSTRSTSMRYVSICSSVLPLVIWPRNPLTELGALGVGSNASTEATGKISVHA
jgi:hypothetical protein